MIGIYALWFEEPSMIYIGQSQDIDRRYNEHLKKLKSAKHTNYKVQNCYDLYGEPELVVLEECSIDKLNELEIVYQKKYNSLVDGLDLIEAGQVGWGVNSSSSKYSKMQILRVFSLLYRTDLQQAVIARKVDVSYFLVVDIKAGKNHVWLREQYPEQYKIMLKRATYRSLGGHEVCLIDPQGQIHKVANIKAFSSKYYPRNSKEWKAFSVGLSRLRTKTRNQYKGWKLFEE